MTERGRRGSIPDQFAVEPRPREAQFALDRALRDVQAPGDLLPGQPPEVDPLQDPGLPRIERVAALLSSLRGS